MRKMAATLLVLALAGCRDANNVAGLQAIALQDGTAVLVQLDADIVTAERGAVAGGRLYWPTISDEADARWRASLARADEAAGSPPPWSEPDASAEWLALGRCREALAEIERTIATAREVKVGSASDFPLERSVLQIRARKIDATWNDGRRVYESSRSK
jgi:hypothetical protein